MKRGQAVGAEQIQTFVTEVFEGDLHAKRIQSLAQATVGAVQAASLSVMAIGRALAMAKGFPFMAKHAIKQVDRLLSNGGLDVERLFAAWVPYVLAERKEAVVALDWTEFDPDGQSTLVATLVTKHGRATPLLWKTVLQAELEGRRAGVEDAALLRLRECIPDGVAVTVLMDRGFADIALYGLLERLGFDFIVRFRGDIWVESSEGERRKAKDWVPPKGHARQLHGAKVTGACAEVGAVVCVRKKGMKDAWCLATSFTEAKPAEVVNAYARRFTCEETFRDVKDLRFGMGLSSVRIARPDRRDRLLLISALAQALLTLLGAAGESLGYDRGLKANTSKKRTHSLFFQGGYYYQALVNWPDHALTPLVERFGQLVRAQPVFQEAFGLV